MIDLNKTETPEEKEALDRISTEDFIVVGNPEKFSEFKSKWEGFGTTNAQFESLAVEVNSEPVWKNGDKCVWNGNDAVFIGYSHSHKSRCAIEYVKDFCSVIDTVFIDSLSKPETPDQKAAREAEELVQFWVVNEMKPIDVAKQLIGQGYRKPE